MFGTVVFALFFCLIVVSVLSTSLYYLLGYARITAWLRPLLPYPIQAMLTCSACSGFWLGQVVSGGLFLSWLALEFSWPSLAAVGLLTLVSGLWSMTTTPILFRLVLDSLKALAQDLEENAPEEISGEEDTLRG